MDFHPPSGLPFRDRRHFVASFARLGDDAGDRASAAHRATGLIFSPETTYLSPVDPLDRFPRGCACAILSRMEARTPASFVGRARELTELVDALEAALAGRG